MTASFDPLATASEQLRHQSRQRAVEIAGDVLKYALQARRGSLPIRAQAPYDFVRVSEQVVRTLLRAGIDDLRPDCAVGRIVLDVDRDERLRELTIELFVQYGSVLVDVADDVRATVAGVLSEVLGADEVGVSVVASHVHVSDVTLASPHLVDPDDEAPSGREETEGV